MVCNALVSLRNVGALVLAGALVACASAGYEGRGGGMRYAGLECAPFARELSGIALYGDAADWWYGAAGRYARASQPAIGGVLVFRRSGRLPEGHVSVVSRLLGARQIAVIQANWVHDEVDLDQLVVDVSANNDWTAVRVWYPPAGQLGATTYATYGFLWPTGRATHDALLQATPVAAEVGLGAARGRPTPSARLYGG